MDHSSLYVIVKEIISGLSAKDQYFKSLPDQLDETVLLNELGLDIITLPDLAEELKTRLGGRDLGIERLLNPTDVNSMTLGQFLAHIQSALAPKKGTQTVVYVDDEEENLFIFTRKYGKRLSLKTFTDPLKALEYIRNEESVGLVITDEVMPNLTGNQLCDEVHKSKPKLRFILITGNPNSDEDLMYRTLKKNRFYDFINKPLDFERKGEEYFNLIQGILSFDW
ncbi:MAG: two-component hybrid sensor and regulator [Fibrobacteres bacterium]|nr:two-component hybrid sensor and regulator [Fibrobacterota bacterium]